MRHLNVDWGQIAGWLELWASLSADDQRAFLSLKSNETKPAHAFTEQGREQLVKAGFLRPTNDKKRVRRHNDGREFSKVMRAMDRHRFDAESDQHELGNYICDHLTTEERQALLHQTTPHGAFGSNANFEAVARRDWIEQVLNLSSAEAALAWERHHLPAHAPSERAEDGAPYFGDEALWQATHRLISEAMRWPEPVPIAGLPERVPDVDRALLFRAVMPAVRYLLLFPWLDSETLQPVIGIWPPVAHLLHRPAPKRPEAVEPEEVFHAPLLIEDMVTVLVAAAAEPLRVKANGDGLYAKDLRRLTEAAMATPDWLANDPAGDAFAEPGQAQRDRFAAARLSHAVRQCREFDLLKKRKHGKQHRLEITKAARDWLAQDAVARLRVLVEPWRKEPTNTSTGKAGRRNAPFDDALASMGAIDQRGGDWWHLSPWTPPSLRWGMSPQIREVDWRSVFLDLLADADGQFVPLNDLLNYHCRVNNPLLGRRAEGSYGPTPKVRMFGRREMSELQLEALWQRLIEEKLFEALLPLGGIELGKSGSGLAVRLHPIGRYMLGLVDELDYHAPPEGDVIIQPNFEVSFLGPAPRAEATIGRLAERTGAGTGTIFRITRASIRAAAAAGIDADQALRDLETVSTKPLPDNVRREVRGWFDATRHVKMRRTRVIEAPDQATAQRILAAAGQKQARQHTDTLIEITTTDQNHTALMRKLKQAGIFVQ